MNPAVKHRTRPHARHASLVLGVAALALASAAHADHRSGKQIVDGVCINCHGVGHDSVKGSAKAPKTSSPTS